MDRAANTLANIDDNIEPCRLANYRTDKVHSCYWWLVSIADRGFS